MATLVTSPTSSPRLWLIFQKVWVFLVTLCVSSCMDVTVLSYGPLIKTLDADNELKISTYPAGFPRQTAGIPYLYKALRTPERVYFQVFVRARGTTAGPNPNVDSILIKSVSYYFPGQEPIELVSNYDDYFWMQDNPRYDETPAEPAPFDEHWHLRVRIDMTLNGKDYFIDERLDANTERSLRPLIFYALQ